MAGSTLGIIGYSAIGRRLAEIMQALGATVLIADPHAEIERYGITLRPLPQLLAQVEIVVCLAVASLRTENLLDEAALGRMRRGALLINASRSKLVDEEALSRAFGQRAVQRWIAGEILIDIAL